MHNLHVNVVEVINFVRNCSHCGIFSTCTLYCTCNFIPFNDKLR